MAFDSASFHRVSRRARQGGRVRPRASRPPSAVAGGRCPQPRSKDLVAGWPRTAIPDMERTESLADDLNLERGVVRRRVTLLLRSVEIKPLFYRFDPFERGWCSPTFRPSSSPGAGTGIQAGGGEGWEAGSIFAKSLQRVYREGGGPGRGGVRAVGGVRCKTAPPQGTQPSGGHTCDPEQGNPESRESTGRYSCRYLNISKQSWDVGRAGS